MSKQRRKQVYHYAISPRAKSACILDGTHGYQGSLWVGDTCWFGVLEAASKADAERQLEAKRQAVARRYPAQKEMA